METSTINHGVKDRSWERIVLKYAHPSLNKSIWQIFNSLIPYLILMFLMYKSLEYPYWVTLLISIPACGFLIRLFIIFHDCGHGSFFRSKNANRAIGILTGLLSFTPFFSWHRDHSIHHATSGNLDKRGAGDVMTMTVREYLNSTGWSRFYYKTYRNPFILFTLGPIFTIFLKNRFSNRNMTRGGKMSIWFTNIAGLTIVTAISLLIGFKAFLLIQLPVLLISHSIGIWLFYIQHQFDDVSWERAGEWDYREAALKGSSFLKLPAILQWFTGNIGFHHVHHLSSRIPNYNLSRCHYENEIFKQVRPLRISKTFRALTMSLWDEAEGRLISFRKLRMARS